MPQQPFGVYLNIRERKAVRINSPYWVPRGPEWVLLTPEVNATLRAIRQLVQEKKVVERAEEITWGEMPHKPDKP